MGNTIQPDSKIGYTRREFNQIFQIYSRHVYTGLFRDFSFSEINGCYFISFKEDAGQTPLITVEKRKLGPDRSLFVATTRGPKGRIIEIARSEKIKSFVDKLHGHVDVILKTKTEGNSNIKGMYA